jgi:hypothetical protein
VILIHCQKLSELVSPVLKLSNASLFMKIWGSLHRGHIWRSWLSSQKQQHCTYNINTFLHCVHSIFRPHLIPTLLRARLMYSVKRGIYLAAHLPLQHSLLIFFNMTVLYVTVPLAKHTHNCIWDECQAPASLPIEYLFFCPSM